MAFVANLTQIKYNADHKPGGCPQTMICKDCRKPFEYGDLINGPTRNRAEEPYYNPDTRPHGFQVRYWHEECKFPKGRAYIAPTNTNIEPMTASIPVSAAPQNAPPTPSNGSDMIADIVAAINKSLLPQLEAATDNLEAGLAALRTNVDTKIATLATAIAQEAAQRAILLERIAKLEANQPTQINISNGYHTTSINVGTHHHLLPDLIELIINLHPERRNVWLAGPAGSGKTTAAKQLASTLIRTTPPTSIPILTKAAPTPPNAQGDDTNNPPTPIQYTVGAPLPFYFNGAIDTEYKLSGFIDANGNVINTAFREAWTNGGVYLFDECDASLSGALTAFNGALANGQAPFPGTLLPIKRHPDCFILAAANTWGFGGDAHYVGRAKLDGAFLSRFIRISWDYDERLERLISSNDEWVDAVRAARDSINKKGIAFLITPRDSLNGADLLRAGLPRKKVTEHIFGYIKRQSSKDYDEHFTSVERFAKVT